MYVALIKTVFRGPHFKLAVSKGTKYVADLTAFCIDLAHVKVPSNQQARSRGRSSDGNRNTPATVKDATDNFVNWANTRFQSEESEMEGPAALPEKSSKKSYTRGVW